MGYSISSSFIEARQMKQWTQVDAVLHRAGYETHSGEDSDTYEAYAEYTYSFQGRQFTNDRVAISGGADNIGDYQQDLGRRLSSAMGRGESIVVYVNPKDASVSIIDPALRWGLLGFKSIFFFVFGGVGLGLMIFAFRAPKEKDPSAPQYAGQPWLANDSWQGDPIKSGSKKVMWFAWGFAALWNLISAPLPFVIYGEIVDKNNMLAIIGLLFPVVGLGLLWWAISRTLEWRRFGPAPLSLDPFPGSIGGHVGGSIDISFPYDSAIRFSITLTSLRSYMSGSGDSRSRKESAKWQDSQVAHATSGAKGTRLSFRFDVPTGLAESDADQSEDSYDLWRLNLQAELPGADIDRDYEIPVYARGEKSSRLSNFSINEAQAAQRGIDLDVIRKMVDLAHGVDGKSMRFPMFRNLASGISGFFFGGIFSAVGWFLFDQEDLLFMGGIFGLVGMVIFVSSLYFLLNSLEVIQSGSTIQTVRRILGVPVTRREMRKSDFIRFDKKSSLSTQSGTKHVMHYKLYARHSGGKDLMVGEGFKGASQADAAAEFIANEFGLRPKEEVPDESDGFGNENVLTAD
jgi:hypothetical protein